MNRTAHEQLDTLRSEALALGAMLVASIPRSTAILLDQDMEGAGYQILADDEYDARSLRLEDAAIALMALHAPVAGQLRHAVLLMKISAELERSADLVTNLCKVARKILGHRIDPSLAALVNRMGHQAEIQMREAMAAYEEQDLARARGVEDMDVHLDALQKEFMKTIFEVNSTDGVEVGLGVQCAMMARFFERIGDHAVNIAHLVEFQISGEKPPSGDHRRGGRGDDLTPIAGMVRPTGEQSS